MSGFAVKPIKLAQQDERRYKSIPSPIPKPPLAMCCVAARRNGKSTVIVNLLTQVYAKVFREVIIISQTIAHDSTYAPLSKLKNVSIHDVRKAPIDNELLAQIWARQEQVLLEDPSADLLVVFDDLGSKYRSKDMLSGMKKWSQLSRHPRISYICIAQSLLNFSSEMISNATSWIIFKLNARDLRRCCETLATKMMDRDALSEYISRNTVKPYSWILINLIAARDEDVYNTYDPETGAFNSGLLE